MDKKLSRPTRMLLTVFAAAAMLAAACSGGDSNASPTASLTGTTTTRSVGTTTAGTQGTDGSSTAGTSTATATTSASEGGAAAACTPGAAVTPAQTEGPYFKAGAPERTAIAAEAANGTPLVVTGVVLDVSCHPIAGATLEFWQADADGVYDNTGYNLRGSEKTDASGRYRVETIEPGLYPGRTRHIHVKVEAPGKPVLTTQLYFPNEPGNTTDSIFDAALILNMASASAGSATFTFILPA